MARRTKRRSAPKRRRRTTFKKRRSPRKSMARRKRSSTRSFRRTGSSIVNTVRPAAAGIGMGMIAETISDNVAPQFSQIAGLGGAYLGGGIKGVIGKVAFDAVSGKSGILSQFGIGGGQQNGGLTV